ncbi:hypothetical protein [Microbacterium sp.]|uniref:hypothetical protein n=1 Tax=Microbacterium sp. TaxID=51671 RepID=UPI0028A1FBCA|nr:hypothetical protein [Microbacterium sp.]
MISTRIPSRRGLRLLAIAPAAALALSLAACAGESRPSVDEVADGIQKVFEGTPQEEAMTDDAATCLAEALVDSDLSDETLVYIADGEDKQRDEADKALTTQIIQDNLQDCVTP